MGVLLPASLSAQAPDRVVVTALPKHPRIERGKGALHLHFDLKIENHGVAKRIDRLDLKVLDANGALVQKKYVDRSGTAPGVDTVRWTPLASDSTCHVFNPFYTFDKEVVPHTLVLVVTFRYGNQQQQQTITVVPNLAEPLTKHRLPMHDRLLVTDGHDFLSHHRRMGLDHPVCRTMGLTSNSSRYALDLSQVDKHGRAFANAGAKHNDWYGWGAPVLATADGVVAAMQSDIQDNKLTARGTAIYDPKVSPRNRDSLLGNYVMIDHGNGEISAMGHLKKGSLLVKLGQRVKAGEQVASLGLSGATSHVHLHFEVQDSVRAWNGEGIPATFYGYRRHLGSRSIDIAKGTIDSGDIVQAASK